MRLDAELAHTLRSGRRLDARRRAGVGLVGAVAVEIEREAGRRPIRVGRHGGHRHRIARPRRRRRDVDRDHRRHVVEVHVEARHQLSHRARVIGDPRGGRVAPHHRVGIAVLGVRRLSRPEQLRDLVLAIAMNVELDLRDMPVRVNPIDRDLGDRRRAGRRREHAQPPTGRRVPTMDRERADLTPDPPVLIGRTHPHDPLTRREHRRGSLTDRIVERPITIQIPRIPHAPPGTARDQHDRRPSPRRRGQHPDRRRRPPSITPPTRLERRVAHHPTTPRRSTRDRNHDRGPQRQPDHDPTHHEPATVPPLTHSVEHKPHLNGDCPRLGWMSASTSSR